jgi:DNA-binding Lrp family transcriptional regulator
MRDLDKQEKLIVRELIRNPRLSDNQISKKTKIPVMSVNRKRKALEKAGLLRYFTSLDTGEDGTGKFKAKQLYIVKFNIGITREKFLREFDKNTKTHPDSAHYISLSYLGEKDGHLTYMCILDAETESMLLDEFNGKIIPSFVHSFGSDCIKEVVTMRVTNTIRRHHNYLPIINMKDGVIKEDWPDDYIFVDEEYEKEQAKSKLSD